MWHVRGRDAYRVLGKKPEGQRKFRRPWRRWENNIKTDLRELVWRPWIDLAQDTDRWLDRVNMAMNLRVPQNAENFVIG
jgi:hypothetical protein